MKAILLALAATALMVGAAEMSAQKYYQKEIESGVEPVHKYGMDSTWNWWVITEPFAGRYRLNVNGDKTDVYTVLNPPVFSPNAEHWAAFGVQDNVVYIIADWEQTPVKFNNVNAIEWSGDGNILAVEGAFADLTEVTTYSLAEESFMQPIGTYRTQFRTSRVFVSYTGKKVAFVATRGSLSSVVINGKDLDGFDRIIPIGFWHDDKFLYAAANGNQWRVYLDTEPISPTYNGVPEVAINRFGTAAAWICSYNVNSAVALISKSNLDPQTTTRYDGLLNLTLHPTEPSFAVNAIRQGANMVVFNQTEYGAEQNVGRTHFTHDGKELTYIDCRVDCVMSLNGERNKMNANLDVNLPYVSAPGTYTYAFAGATSLVVRDMKTANAWTGTMLDATIDPRFNWRENRYELMGMINKTRLLLLVCSMDEKP